MTSIALISGATGAIGKAIARRLAAKSDYEVVLLGRNQARAEQAVHEIKSVTGNPRVSFALVDLSRRGSIEAFAAAWQKPVNVLVNNAAIAPPLREETPEGIEMQFATNVLGYCRLTRALEPWLIQAGSARVVNVASYWAGDLDLHDLEFRHRPYDQHQAYRQSKQANRMLTVAFAERLKPHGVTVNACHSGDVHSTLSHALGFGGHETPEQGARTPVWLATDPGVQALTGKYFEQGREIRCLFAQDRRKVAALDEACRLYAR
ncbi:MAG TPA: SDR family NAD(P)-dependent oxidoreductase [Methylococcaceae bacterium]|nr:SDR family NAD(P)-dependent oxidoreductase [Methylococcaceae bacterium]